MAFFNPKYLEFNPNASVIQNAGALGRGIYDIYKDNVVRKQEYDKQQETIRANQALEQHRQDSLDETKRHHGATEDIALKNYNLALDKFNADQDNWNKEFKFKKDQAILKQKEEVQKLDNELLSAKALFDETNKIYSSNGTPIALPANFEKLSPQGKLSVLNAFNKAYGGAAATKANKEATIKLDNAATQDELMASFEANKTDPYFASLFNALDENGNINQEALKANFTNMARLNGKKTAETLRNLANDKRLFRDKFASDPSIQQITSLGEQLANIKKLNPNAQVDSYFGIGDMIVDGIKSISGKGSQGADRVQNEALINNLLTAYTKQNQTTGADKERQDLQEPFKALKEWKFIFDNDTQNAFNALAVGTISPMIAKLEKEKENTSGQFQKNYIQGEINKAKTLLANLQRYADFEPKIEYKPTQKKTTNALPPLPSGRNMTAF